ncbi:MAG: hypothetical protein ACC630_06465, partial [Nitrospinota bacterium]
RLILHRYMTLKKGVNIGVQYDRTARQVAGARPAPTTGGEIFGTFILIVCVFGRRMHFCTREF